MKARSSGKRATTNGVVSVNRFSKSGISYRISSTADAFIDGFNVCDKSFYQRPTIILINGLTRTKKHWLGFDEELAEKCNVITLDPRGAGDTRKDASWNHKIDDFVEDVNEITKEMALSNVHILGFSLGGMVALEYTLRFPEKVSSLFVVNSSIGGTRKLRLTPKSLFTLATAGLKNNEELNKKLSDYLLSHTADHALKLDAIKNWIALEHKYGRGVSLAIKQLFAAMRFKTPKRLRKISVPTTVIAGALDKFVPCAHSLNIHHHIPGSKIVTFKNGGHELHMDNREKLLSVVIDQMTES